MIGLNGDNVTAENGLVGVDIAEGLTIDMKLGLIAFFKLLGGGLAELVVE